MVEQSYKNINQSVEVKHHIFKFKEWYSFSDMDNFDSDYLISILTIKGVDGLPFLWSKLKTEETNTKTLITLEARKQAEAIFNLSQLMFALYHGSVTACTFCDLQFNRAPRDIRQSGFCKLKGVDSYTGTVFRKALHSLCWDIAEKGGLPVIFSMMRNPCLPIIRQKCLDALTNILCVDNIEKIVLEKQPWFLDALISMVEKGDLQCDMVPAISVLDRLVVVILSEKMDVPYQQLMKRNFLNICLNRLNSNDYRSQSIYLHFIKFQTITMQAVALLCADEQSVLWPETLKEEIFSYAYKSVLTWNTETPPSDPVWHQSESFYRTMSFSSSALLFSFVILLHSILKWPNKSKYLKEQALVFKYQLSRLMTLQGFSSNTGDVNHPVILNTIGWIWNKLYTKDDPENRFDTDRLYPSVICPLPELCEKVLRKCSNEKCNKMENLVGQWKVCPNCKLTCYCSNECRISHQSQTHTANFCKFLSMQHTDQFQLTVGNKPPICSS